MTDQTINIIKADGSAGRATLKMTESLNSATVVLLLDANQSFQGSDRDYFQAFRKIRKQTDRLNLKLLVQAARPNCWPSGMSSQMSMGLKIYDRSLEKPMSMWKCVNSFDPAEEHEIGTVADQDEFARLLHDKLNNAH